MARHIKIIYLIALSIILIPFAQQWGKTVTIPKKEAFLPPELPTLPKASNDLLNTLLARNLWDKNHTKVTSEATKTQAKTDKPKTKKWRLKGIGYKKNSPPSAIILIGDNATFYHENDTLPDGAQLEKININSIVIKKEGETKHVFLFKDR